MRLNNYNLGLEETEAKVYLALLELGPSTVSEITSKAGITRTLGYHTLQELGWKNLVAKAHDKGKRIIFTPKHPNNVLQNLENRELQWHKKTKEFKKLLPDLVSLYYKADKPMIRYMPGVAGIKDACSEAFDSQTEILSVVDIDLWDTAELRRFGKYWDKEKSSCKIKERQLLLDTASARQWMRDYLGSYKITDFRWIKKEQLPGGIDQLTGNLNIFDNKIVISLLKKPHQMGIVIESDALVAVVKTLFELAWKQGVEVNKKSVK